MKFFYFLFLYLLNNINCGENILEYYTNYTFISPSEGQVNTYYFYPHYEVGTVNFKIRFSNTLLSCTFTVYDGDKKIDSFSDFNKESLEHELKIPESDPKPKKLKLQVTNNNYNYPYYIYLYNNNYTIPLNISKYYYYQLSLDALEINYDIKNISKNVYIKFKSIVEFAEFGDNIYIRLNDGEIEHIFNETSSTFYMPLKRNYNYTLNMRCNFGHKFTKKTAILIYFEENEDNYRTLFNQNYIIIPFQSIFENNKHYFIDSINLIDGYNLYNFNLNEISSKTNLENLKINIYIKKFSTYNINYIKSNTPTSEAGYDKKYIMTKNNSFTIKAGEDHSENDKTILIYVDINYKYNLNFLYEYSIQKITENKTLEFKSYLLNWYTKYDFAVTYIHPNDTVFITTNYSYTIIPISAAFMKFFKYYYNAHLYVTHKDLFPEFDKILIRYNDEGRSLIDENDKGYFEVFKFNNDINSFNEIRINKDFRNQVIYLDINKDCNNFYYIQIDYSMEKDDYYLCYEMLEKNSYLHIEEMPINIIGFSQNNSNTEIVLLNMKKEYIFKIGYLEQEYNLIKAYLVKNENTTELSISEGQIEMYTFPKNNSRINLNINLFSANLNWQNFINLKIPSIQIEKNLYIEYNNEQNGNRYILNNSGINLYFNNKKTINIDIISEDVNNEDIPIMIKFALNINNLKLITSKEFTLNAGEIALYKFNSEKIKMEFSSKKRFTISYYIDYISEENGIKNDNLLLSPELFKKEDFYSDDIFEISSNLTREKINSKNNNKLFLYLIFSFDSRVTVKEPKEGSSFNYTYLLIGIFALLIISIIVIPAIVRYYRNRKIKLLLNRPLIQSGIISPINVNSGTTSGNYDNNNINNNNLNNRQEDSYFPGKNEIVINDGNKNKNGEINNISRQNDAELASPLTT